MKKILLKMFLFVYIFTAPVFSNEIRIYKDAASMGMGGVGVSTMGYSFSPIYNPAALGLMADHDIAPFISLGMSINPEALSILKQVDAIAAGDFANIDYDSLLGKAPTIGLNGPLNVGFMGRGFGFWTTTSADVSTAIIKNPNDPFKAIGNEFGVDIDLSLNDMAQAGEEILNLGDSPNATDVENILNKYLNTQDIINQVIASGGNENDVQDKIDELVRDLAADPSKVIKDLLPLAKFSATIEITANLAYGYKIPFAMIDDVSGLSFGATVRFSQRFKATSGDDFVSIDTLGTTFSDVASNIYQAGSVSSDFGTSLRIENFIFGLSVRDAFSSGYHWKNLDGLSAGLNDSKIPLSLDFGASYRFLFKNKFIQEVGLYLEFEDTTSIYSSWLNKMRLGSEVKLFNFLNLRVGMYDGFITSGIGMGWKWFRMDFAYYRETYFDFFTSDQFYFNMTFGLDNSPKRKAQTVQKQLEQDRIQAQVTDMIDQSLVGL